MKKNNTKIPAVCGLLLALGVASAFLSGLIPFLTLPFGGSVTLASCLPVILISNLYGVRRGLAAGLAFSVLQIILLSFETVKALFTPADEAYMGVVNAVCILFLDYVLAFTVLGLGGLFRRRLSLAASLVWGTVFAMFLSYLCHVLSGFIFYRAWAEWFFKETVFADLSLSRVILDHVSGSALALLYSAIYNACYMLPETVIAAICAVPVSRLRIVREEKC